MTSVAMTQTSVERKNITSLKPRLHGKDVGIPVRKMGLSYATDMPTFWFNDNAFLTMFLSAFSATLPDGEAQFIHSVRLFQDKITEPVLLAQIRAFIGQEGHHSKEHDTLNDAMRERGYNLGEIQDLMVKMAKRWRDTESPQKQLARTVCAEHFTALLADMLLTKHPELLELIAPQVRKIWAWHAIEETEHKAVAFDVYEQLVGDRALLNRTMVGITADFVLVTLYGTMTLMPRTGQMTNWKMWKEGLSFLGKIGRSSWSEYKDFYKSDFHPWQHDNRATVEAAKRKYLGETA